MQYINNEFVNLKVSNFIIHYKNFKYRKFPQFGNAFNKIKKNPYAIFEI